MLSGRDKSNYTNTNTKQRDEKYYESPLSCRGLVIVEDKDGERWYNCLKFTFIGKKKKKKKTLHCLDEIIVFTIYCQ